MGSNDESRIVCANRLTIVFWAVDGREDVGVTSHSSTALPTNVEQTVKSSKSNF